MVDQPPVGAFSAISKTAKDYVKFKKIESILTDSARARNDVVTLQNDVNKRSPSTSDHLDVLRYKIQSTGASISLSSAVTMIHQYCNYLPRDLYSDLKPTFQYSLATDGISFHCTLKMPSNCPLQMISTHKPLTSKSRAKQEVI